LTGPDHLSALATLSANEGNIRHALCLGIRWGIGHSTGLLAVAVIMILISHPSSDQETIEVPEKLATFFESLVGIFMIFLGIYGIRRAWTKRSETYRVIPAVPGVTSTQFEPQSIPMHHVHSARIGDVPIASMHDDKDDSDIEMLNHDSEIITPQHSCFHVLARWITNVSTQSMAVLAGIIHGLAGPGGVLGVIPAVQLHNGRLAALYLSCFCISSTLTMGVFAVVYGSCSSRLVDQGHRPFISGSNPIPGIRQFRIECASACLSIIVGILWLILLLIGKLDDVFP
jgi:ABC-type nickel/cobalt efflux system permease component RcnA